MNMRLFLLSIGLVLGFVASAWGAGCGAAAAQGELCTFESDAGKYFPDEVKKFGQGSAARICTRAGKRTVALFASPVKANDLGVCFFWTRDMNAPVQSNGFPKRTLLMMPGKAPCPRQDDAAYISNDGVPDGVFAELVSRWDAGHFTFPEMKDQGGKKIDFAKIYRTTEGEKRFVLGGVQYESYMPDVYGASSNGSGAFTFIVSDTREPSSSYLFHADWQHGDLRITDVEYLISGC